MEIVFTDLTPVAERQKRLANYELGTINSALQDIKKIEILEITNIDKQINKLITLNNLSSLAIKNLKKLKGEIK